jgi:hypothetical protein
VKGRRFELLEKSDGVLRHPCDLDLVLFFCRHPRVLLTTERLAAYVGYDLNQVERSLDLLTEAGLLERSQNPTQAARMYVLETPDSAWLVSLLKLAMTWADGTCPERSKSQYGWTNVKAAPITRTIQQPGVVESNVSVR